MAESKAEKLYRETHGDEALDRQREEASKRHPCCWEPRDGPHHEVCKNYVPEETLFVIDGQESLL